MERTQQVGEEFETKRRARFARIFQTKNSPVPLLACLCSLRCFVWQNRPEDRFLQPFGYIRPIRTPLASGFSAAPTRNFVKYSCYVPFTVIYPDSRSGITYLALARESFSVLIVARRCVGDSYRRWGISSVSSLETRQVFQVI